MRWVGRPLPRYEDRSLLLGRGRYTVDLARGARKLRFVRSPVACGRILTVNAPPEVPIITAPVLGDINPICPRLDRPDYVPVAQPILADERVNYVGEPIAAVIADTAAEAEDLAEQVAVEIAAETPVVTLDEALAHGAPLVHDAAAKNTLIDARFRNPWRRLCPSSCAASGRIYVHLRAAGGGADGDARCFRRFRCGNRPRHPLGVDANAAPVTHWHCRHPRDSGIRTARHRTGGWCFNLYQISAANPRRGS